MKMDTTELVLNLHDKKYYSGHGNMLLYSVPSAYKATSISCVCTACYNNNSLPNSGALLKAVTALQKQINKMECNFKKTGMIK